MQRTTNYHLTQWDATDKISREDFNADNAAIDAALSALAIGGVGAPWETGTINLGSLEPDEPAKAFEFEPKALIMASSETHTGFVVNGETVQVVSIDGTKAISLVLNGTELEAGSSSGGIPTKILHYLAVK